MSINKYEWVKRNVTDADKVPALIETYNSMGFEVRVDAFDAEECNVECNTCMLETPEKFKIIYTRQKDNFDDELF